MKIIKLGEDEYAIRGRWNPFGHQHFVDLWHVRYNIKHENDVSCIARIRWTRNHRWFKDCVGSLDQVTDIFNHIRRAQRQRKGSYIVETSV